MCVMVMMVVLYWQLGYVSLCVCSGVAFNKSVSFVFFVFFFFKQKTAYEIRLSLVGSEMCIRDRLRDAVKRPLPADLPYPAGLVEGEAPAEEAAAEEAPADDVTEEIVEEAAAEAAEAAPAEETVAEAPANEAPAEDAPAEEAEEDKKDSE